MMSLLENHVSLLLLVFSLSWVLVGSDIYKSVMWTTNNPLFSDSDELSRCFGQDLEMRVHLQSSLPIVCPFDFIIMKTLPSKPATGVLYENFWIAYDRESFEKCNINMTAVSKYGDKNKKLLECNSPEALKSFTYSIDFKAKTPANSGISFVGGEYYYFLATSDGTDGSLNNTAGGHCDDPKVRMKFKVYICRTDVEDEKCQNVSIGEFLCPSDLPEAATTTSPPTTVTSQPSIQITTDSSGGITNSTSTVASTSGKDTSPVTKLKIKGASTTEFENNSSGNESNTARRLGSQDILDKLEWWKNVAIASFCCWVVLIVVILVVCYIKRRKTNPVCFTDINNKVTPPETEPQSPDQEYECINKEPCKMNSFNNLSYAHEDSEDGKPQNPFMSFKPNGHILPPVDKPDKQSQVYPLPPLKDKLHGLKNNDFLTSPEKQGLEEHNQKNDPGKLHPGMNTEKIGNGTPGEKK